MDAVDRHITKGAASLVVGLVGTLVALGIMAAANWTNGQLGNGSILLLPIMLVVLVALFVPGVACAVIGARYGVHLAALPAGLLGAELPWIVLAYAGPQSEDPFLGSVPAIFAIVFGLIYLGGYGIGAAAMWWSARGATGATASSQSPDEPAEGSGGATT